VLARVRRFLAFREIGAACLQRAFCLPRVPFNNVYTRDVFFTDTHNDLESNSQQGFKHDSTLQILHGVFLARIWDQDLFTRRSLLSRSAIPDLRSSQSCRDVKVIFCSSNYPLLSSLNCLAKFYLKPVRVKNSLC